MEVSAVLPTRRRPGITTALMDSCAFVSAAFVTCCHLCRLIGFTLWGFICIVAAFTTERLEQAAFPSCSRCLCQGVPVTGDYYHKGHSWGTVHRGLFTGDGVMEDFLHRLLCSQRTVFMGTVYGEQSMLNYCWRIYLMPFAAVHIHFQCLP